MKSSFTPLTSKDKQAVTLLVNQAGLVSLGAEQQQLRLRDNEIWFVSHRTQRAV
ncbi:MAG: hypothetical protein ACR5K7_01730 [Symbiopectobacterium sp.]